MNDATSRLLGAIKEVLADIRGEINLPTIEEFLEQVKKN
jgi:hypothetical protein